MQEREFVVSVQSQTDALSLHGPIDDRAIDGLRTALAAHLDSPHSKHLLDLSDVDYLPSLAIGELIRSMHQAQDRGLELVLVAPTGTVAQRVLRLTGVPHTSSTPSPAA